MPWYYYRGGIRKGPIEDPAFRQMAAAGELEPTDFVWSPGMKEWARAETVPGLLVPPPPPPESQPTAAELFLEGHSPRAIQTTKVVPGVAKLRQPQGSPAAHVGLRSTSKGPFGETFPDKSAGSLDAASKKIKKAWVAGLWCVAVTFAAVLLSFASPLSLLDIAIVGGLSYGVYRKSRTCAVLLFVIFLLEKIVQLTEDPKYEAGIVVAAIFFGWYFWQGVVGTREYHRLVSQSGGSHATEQPV